jgi:hypothetical protein
MEKRNRSFHELSDRAFEHVQGIAAELITTLGPLGTLDLLAHAMNALDNDELTADRVWELVESLDTRRETETARHTRP